MVFNLSGGDITKSKTVSAKFSYREAVKWLLLKKYESYMEDKAIRHGRE